MQGFEVKLSDTGMFEIPALAPGWESFRIGCNSEDVGTPWCVLGTDETGVKWRRIRSFSTLDQALNFAVSSVENDESIREFNVLLPCGGRFRRPGRIAAEEVMASMGWIYVETVTGFAMLSTPATSGDLQARKEFLKIIEDTQLTLGSVDLTDEVDGKRHWCADVTVSYECFIHRDDLDTQFALSFASEGLKVITHMDYRARILMPADVGNVVDFLSYRQERVSKAA